MGNRVSFLMAGVLLASAPLAAFAGDGDDERAPDKKPAEVPKAEPVDWPAPPSKKLGPLEENPSNTVRKARAAALDWLARHQAKTGAWGEDPRTQGGTVFPSPGKPEYAAGLTGLAALAFLRAGVKPDSEKHGIVLKRALVWLRARQDEHGSFPGGGSNHHIYNHTIATLALCEAYGVTKDPHIGTSARRALDWIRKAQNPYSGWRYGVRPRDSDTSVTGWAVQALVAGRQAGLEVEDRHFEGALAYVNKVTNKKNGRVGYNSDVGDAARPNEMLAAFPPAATASMTAAGTLVRVMCGEHVADEQVILAVAACQELAPVWDIKAGRTDLYYWYYGTLLMRRVGKSPWRKWKKALEGALPPWQRGKDDGESRGSWDPVGPWGPDGGRILSTALGALMLDEVIAN